MEEGERCPRCGGDAGDNWFDRSLCPCNDTMHTCCRSCGYALDGCPFESLILTCGCGRQLILDESPFAREGQYICPTREPGHDAWIGAAS